MTGCEAGSFDCKDPTFAGALYAQLKYNQGQRVVNPVRRLVFIKVPETQRRALLQKLIVQRACDICLTETQSVYELVG